MILNTAKNRVFALTGISQKTKVPKLKIFEKV